LSNVPPGPSTTLGTSPTRPTSSVWQTRDESLAWHRASGAISGIVAWCKQAAYWSTESGDMHVCVSQCQQYIVATSARDTKAGMPVVTDGTQRREIGAGKAMVSVSFADSLRPVHLQKMVSTIGGHDRQHGQGQMSVLKEPRPCRRCQTTTKELMDSHGRQAWTMTARSILQALHKPSRRTACPEGQSPSSRERKTHTLGKTFGERFVGDPNDWPWGFALLQTGEKTTYLPGAMCAPRIERVRWVHGLAMAMAMATAWL
jgi:hypothetical protein